MLSEISRHRYAEKSTFLRHWFTFTRNKYYQDANTVDPLHSNQFTQFLYFLSKELIKLTHEESATRLANKIYYLNKALHSCDLYHGIDLPPVFGLDHPLGSVMGRAPYGNYFSFQQRCSIGNNKGIYPTIGNHVRMFANSTIIGNSTIGDNVFISANTYIKDENIPDKSIVFGSSPDLVIKSRPLSYFESNSLFNLNAVPR